MEKKILENKPLMKKILDAYGKIITDESLSTDDFVNNLYNADFSRKEVLLLIDYLFLSDYYKYDEDD